MGVPAIEQTLSAPAASRVTSIAPWKASAVFYAVACGITWTVWLPLVLGQDGFGLLHIAPSVPVFISLGTLGPLISCFATYRLQSGNFRAVHLLPRAKREWLWLVSGPMLVVMTLFVIFPALVSKGSATTWHFAVLPGLLIPVFNFNLLGGPLFEEFGWRGFLQPQLERVLPAWLAAVAVATMWATWHLPLFFVKGWTSASVPVFVLILIGLSLLMALAFNASGRSVAVAILMHSTFNAAPQCLGDFLRGVAMREHPSGELLMASSLLIVGASLALLTRGKLSFR